LAYCKKCGCELNPGANFCPNCGESTSQSSVVSQDGKGNEVTTSSKPQVQKVASTQKKTKVAHKRKRKEPIHYDWWVKVLLVIGGCLLIYSLLEISNNSIIVWGANFVGCLAMLYAIVTILIGKSEIDSYGAKVLAIVSLLWFPIMKGLDYWETADAKDRVENFRYFSDALPSNGSRLFVAEKTKPYGSKNVTLKRIILYEKDGEMDYQLEGVTSSGRHYSEKGGWSDDQSKTYQAVTYNYTHLCAGNMLTECTNYFIDYEGKVFFCTGIYADDEDVANAFKRGPIAKLRIATDKEVEDWQHGNSGEAGDKGAITIEPKSQEEKDYADKGYKDGAEFGSVGGLLGDFGGMLDMADAVGVTGDEMDSAIRKTATSNFVSKYESSISSNKERLKEIYIQHYIEGFKSTTKTSNN
jgi:hypothetical protein